MEDEMQYLLDQIIQDYREADRVKELRMQELEQQLVEDPFTTPIQLAIYFPKYESGQETIPSIQSRKTITVISVRDGNNLDNRGQPFLVSLYDVQLLRFLRNGVKIEDDQQGNVRFTVNHREYMDFVNNVIGGRFTDDWYYTNVNIQIGINKDLLQLYFKILKDEDMEPRLMARANELIIQRPGSEVLQIANQDIIEGILRDYNLMLQNPPPLPYNCFSNNDGFERSNNCLINVIKQFYQSKDGKNGISESTIDKFFQKSTTVGNLIDFMNNKAKAKLIIMDIFGRVVYKNQDESHKTRKSLAAIVYSNHIYVYTEKVLARKIKVDYKPETPNGNSTIRVNRPDFDEKSVISFSSNIDFNFSYKSEESVYPRSLLYYNEIDNFNDKIVFGDYEIVEYDMIKAFYSTMNTISDENECIPVFKPNDRIVKYDNSSIVPHAIYYVSNSFIEKESTRKRGIYSNIHHGFVIMYLLSKNLITYGEIEYYKQATYRYITIKKYRKYIFDTQCNANKIDPIIYDRYVEIKKQSEINRELENTEQFKFIEKEYKLQVDAINSSYSMYNGIMGKKRTSPLSTQLDVHENQSDDVMLLRAVNQRESKYENQENVLVSHVMSNQEPIEYKEVITMQFNRRRKSTYKLINNRNVYDFCISRTNLVMLKAYDEFIELNPSLDIMRVVTDCITFLKKTDESVKIPNSFNNVFRQKSCEIEKLRYKNSTVSYVDGSKIAENIEKELDVWSESIKGYMGAPGTGKTYKVQHDEEYDVGMTVTNACCQNMNHLDKPKADTTYTTLGMYSGGKTGTNNHRDAMNRLSGKKIWADEFSMFSQDIFSSLFTLIENRGSKLIISGDMNQIGPINEPPLTPECNIARALGKCITLTENRRAVSDSGRRLHELTLQIPSASKEQTIEIVKNLLTEKLMCVCNVQEARMHLVYTNNRRKMINNHMMEVNGYVFNYDEVKKRFDISIGTRIKVNHSLKSKGLFKSVIYEVVGMENIKEPIMTATGKSQKKVKGVLQFRNSDVVKIRNISDNQIMEIHENLLAYFTLGFAMTVHSAQGMTIREKCIIHEIDSMLKSDKRILYTALTRFTKSEDLFISREKIKEDTSEKDFEHLISLKSDIEYDRLISESF